MKKSIILTLFGAMLLSSCTISKDQISVNSESVKESQEKESNSNSNSTVETVYQDFLVRTPAQHKKENEAALRSYNDEIANLGTFTNKLANELYTQSNDNVAYSPLSIYMAFSLLSECAAGDSRNQIMDFLGLDYDANKEFFSHLYNYLQASNESFTREITNSIWLQKEREFKDDCLDSLANNYYCYPFEVDFLHENDLANKMVHDFIYEKTHELIDLNPEFSVNTLLALMNTLYIKDVWDEPLSLTYNPMNFTNYDGSVTNTKLMNTFYNQGKVYQNDLYSQFYTITKNGHYLKILVPNEGHTVDELFQGDILAKANNQRYVYEDEEYIYKSKIILPKFEASYNESINEQLKKLGLNSIFEECDLTNLTDADCLLSKVIHATKYIVDENGTEGAAVTIIEVCESAEMPIKPTQTFVLKADKPFVYMLTTSNDIPLFVGAVRNI